MQWVGVFVLWGRSGSKRGSKPQTPEKEETETFCPLLWGMRAWEDPHEAPFCTTWTPCAGPMGVQRGKSSRGFPSGPQWVSVKWHISCHHKGAGSCREFEAGTWLVTSVDVFPQPTASHIHSHLKAMRPRNQGGALAKYLNIWTAASPEGPEPERAEP